MKKNMLIKTVGFGCLLAHFGVLAGTEYEIDKYVVASGGETSTGGAYVITATIGQATANVSSGGDYVVTSGFWQQDTDLIFTNEFE